MSDPAWSLELSTPLGKDALELLSFEGTESISDPFHFTLVARTESAYVDPAALVGKSIDVTLQGGDGIARVFNGVVARLTQGSSRCTIEMRPWLWLLTLARNDRIFQNLDVIDILKKVFADYAGSAMRSDTVLTYAKIDYCVQYDESDFDFVSRLMETAGIAYRFEHKAGTHTLVLVDDPAKFPACPNAATVPWQALGPGGDWLADARIESVELERRAVADGFAAGDYNFTTPATALLGKAGQGRVYEYPGGFELKADADAVAKRRGEELAALAGLLHGTSPLRHLASGTAFSLTRHPADPFNGKYVLMAVTHRAERRGYENSFAAFPAAVPFRPARRTRRPRIAGAQTAIVVGPADKEIWTDRYGRIKVQFHWDRLGRNDENSSCWVRVAQAWSGKSWGAFTLPRIGQEVVVSFLEGDPDRPLVTGCVYNGDNPVPYALPENQTRTTIKTQSSPKAVGFNELRFEDKKDSEEVFLQAQKDLNVVVLNNAAETVKKDRTVTVEEGNDVFTVSKGDWTTSVATGNATHGVKGNSTVTIEGNSEETVSGNLTINVTGNVTIKASGSVAIEAGTGMTLKGGTTVAIEAGTALTLKGLSVEVTAGATGKFDGGGMLELKGGLVKLN
jgi:type VI secretion system secreted protein VgrG